MVAGSTKWLKRRFFIVPSLRHTIMQSLWFYLIHRNVIARPETHPYERTHQKIKVLDLWLRIRRRIVFRLFRKVYVLVQANVVGLTIVIRHGLRLHSVKLMSRSSNPTAGLGSEWAIAAGILGAGCA